MRRLLLLCALVLALTATGTAATFGTSFTVYEDGTAELDTFEWLPNSSVKEPVIGGEYELQLWGEGEQLYERSFGVSFDPVFATANGTNTTDDDGAGTNSTGPRSRYLFYRLPYEPAAERFAVVHDGRALLNITIPDRICRADGECPVYCRQEGREDADCEPRQEDTGVPVLMVLGAVLVVIGIGLFLWHRRDDEGQDDGGPEGRQPARPTGPARRN